jgi:hypothetical protein
MNRLMLGSSFLGIFALSVTAVAQEKPAADAAKLLTPEASLNLPICNSRQTVRA